MFRALGTLIAIGVMLGISGCGELLPLPVPEGRDTTVTPTTSSSDAAPPEAGSEAQPTQQAVQATPTQLAIAFAGEPPSGEKSLEVIQARIAEQQKEERHGPQPTPTPRPRLVIISPEMVAAPAIGLMWQSRVAGMFSADDAGLYCRNLASGGHSDWRVPSIAELERVVGAHKPSFRSQAEMLWSTTPHGVRGLLVYDLQADKTSHLTRELAHVVCVRSY